MMIWIWLSKIWGGVDASEIYMIEGNNIKHLNNHAIALFIFF